MGRAGEVSGRWGPGGPPGGSPATGSSLPSGERVQFSDGRVSYQKAITLSWKPPKAPQSKNIFLRKDQE